MAQGCLHKQETNIRSYNTRPTRPMCQNMTVRSSRRSFIFFHEVVNWYEKKYLTHENKRRVWLCLSGSGPCDLQP